MSYDRYDKRDGESWIEWEVRLEHELRLLNQKEKCLTESIEKLTDLAERKENLNKEIEQTLEIEQRKSND